MAFPTTALGNQYPTGFTDAAGMQARFDVPAEAMAGEMRTWGHDFPKFSGSRGGGAVQVGSNIAFSATYDTTGDWDSTNNLFNVQKTGLYIIAAEFTQVSAVPFTLQIMGLPAAYHNPLGKQCEAAAGKSARVAGLPVSLTAGAQIAVQVAGTAPTLAAPTAGTAPRNYFFIAMAAHR